jgi:hypothetical protein
VLACLFGNKLPLDHCSGCPHNTFPCKQTQPVAQGSMTATQQAARSLAGSCSHGATPHQLPPTAQTRLLCLSGGCIQGAWRNMPAVGMCRMFAQLCAWIDHRLESMRRARPTAPSAALTVHSTHHAHPVPVPGDPVPVPGGARTRCRATARHARTHGTHAATHPPSRRPGGQRQWPRSTCMPMTARCAW